MDTPMREFREGGVMDETPMQRALRLSRENGYYGHFSDDLKDKEIEFTIQPRRKRDADA